MDKKSIFVNLTVEETVKLVKEEIENKFMTCNMVDKYKQTIDDKIMCVLILEKYFMRVENRVTVTIVIDNFVGKTRIHLKAAGSSASFLMRFDWGAASRFENDVYLAFEKYMIK